MAVKLAAVSQQTIDSSAYSYYVEVVYKNNARLLDDNASGEYGRYFEDKYEAWQYVKAVGRHAEAKPYMSVKAVVVDLCTHKHVYGTTWNWR